MAKRPELTPLDRRLIKIFKDSSFTFSSKLRKLLIVAVQEGEGAAQARKELQLAADNASKTMKQASAAWTRARIPAAVREGASSVGLRFGGVNTRLLTRLTQETAKDLLSASEGPERLLRKGLRRGQALMLDADLAPVSADARLTEGLTRSVLNQETVPQIRNRLLRELGLDKGDKIMLENGQQWDAQAYAELLARTRPAEAENQAKYDAAIAQGYEYIEMSYHKGVKEDDICFLLQGRVFALAPNNPLGLPVLPAEWGLPPWHPNCLHTFGVWQPQFQTAAEIQAVLEKQAGLADGLQNY